MARYFFNIHDGEHIIDHAGTECADLDQARSQAIRTAGEILRDKGGEFWKGELWRMEVTDESDNIVFSLNFSAD